MGRVNLIVSLSPPQAQVIVSFIRHDGSFLRFETMVDTGAEVSLFPISLLQEIEHILIPEEQIEIQQAGIAGQEFTAQTAIVRALLEDFSGGGEWVTFRAWFAKTSMQILGFDGVLDRATLYLDMRQTRTGWMEFNG